jgi:predicted RNA-binding protein with TRAM domain
MKIKMLALAAGPEGNYYTGTIYDVSEAEGSAFIKGGYAVLVEETKMVEEVTEEVVDENPRKRKKK